MTAIPISRVLVAVMATVSRLASCLTLELPAEAARALLSTATLSALRWAATSLACQVEVGRLDMRLRSALPVAAVSPGLSGCGRPRAALLPVVVRLALPSIASLHRGLGLLVITVLPAQSTPAATALVTLTRMRLLVRSIARLRGLRVVTARHRRRLVVVDHLLHHPVVVGHLLHHLVVVDPRLHLRGLVTLLDLVRAATGTALLRLLDTVLRRGGRRAHRAGLRVHLTAALGTLVGRLSQLTRVTPTLAVLALRALPTTNTAVTRQSPSSASGATHRLLHVVRIAARDLPRARTPTPGQALPLPLLVVASQRARAQS